MVNRLISLVLVCLAGAVATRVSAADAKDVKPDRKFFEDTVVLAQNGDAMAQCALGACFESGQGVLKDYGEAVKWYRKAAAQGDAMAQCALGACYEAGRGVDKDAAQAVKWYSQSAEKGCMRAQFNLAACYANGNGITKDYLEAHKWYTQAALKDFAPATKALPGLEKRMTPEQLSQAKRAAAPLWLKKKTGK